ncbi:hypothetical protein ACEN2I_00260 [Flavobacterium sp. W22_SRS_FK3]|uniref:hypothetical protein n=1 Tax=Flavobacterium sp. W22_SRS_FK3 TaxID=3240275 RepID=UPI003F8EC35F
MKKIFLLLFFFSLNQTFCQDINEDSEQKIQHKIYSKCFESLKAIPEIENHIPLKIISFCSLLECIMGFEYAKDERTIQEAISKRAIEISVLLYDQGTPIYLTSGMDSSYDADEKNQNLTDDNHLVYISIAECLSSKSLEKIKDIINEQTKKLINKNQTKTYLLKEEF